MKGMNPDRTCDDTITDWEDAAQAVVDLHRAGHYVFLPREAEALREIQTFIAKLK